MTGRAVCHRVGVSLARCQQFNDFDVEECVMREYYIYILTNVSRTLYIGVTNDLLRRIHEHRSGVGSEFTRKYNVHQLAYYESTNSVWVAIEREKELKNLRRSKKIALIEALNPNWNDLSAEWQRGEMPTA